MKPFTGLSGRTRPRKVALWTHLRQLPKLGRKRYRSYDSRGRLAKKRHLSKRPASVETPQYKGHWESDTVMGKGSLECIVTLVERKTERRNGSTKKPGFNRDPTGFKTITADKGTEFHQYKVIEA